MSIAIAKYLYEMTSARVNKKWEGLKKSRAQDSIVKNRKLFSHVLNCTITDDNPYLLTGTSLEGIRKELGFKDNTEVMFGDDAEIESYAEDLFYLFFDEYVVIPNGTFPKDEYVLFYCDYLPYAKNHTLATLLSDKGIKEEDIEFRETLFQTTLHDLKNQLECLTPKARQYVFWKNKDWFITELYGFIDKTTSYKKLPQKIDSFASEVFIKKLKDMVPTSKTSLGIRAKELMENDLAINDQELRVYNWQNTKEEYQYRLFQASLMYVNSLEEIFSLYFPLRQ